jgi:anti-sigma B factor antagonist
MNISCEEYDQVAVIGIDGELSADTLEVFKSTVRENLKLGHLFFVIGFEKVSFIDSQGLEALLWLKDECESRKGQVKLAGLDETQVKILSMTRLNRNFDIHDQIVQAVKSF